MLLATVVSIIALALAAPWLVRALGARRAGIVMALLPAALTAYFLFQIPHIAGEGVRLTEFPFASGLDIAIAMRLDGLGLLFALLICGVGALVVLYSAGYMANHPAAGRFFFSLLLFMSAMLGIVLADDLILLFVFWELTSLSSYLLIGFDHHREKARKSALQALLVTALGGLLLLAGLVLLGQAAGTWRLSEILTMGDAVRANDLYTPILVLVLLGAFTKSAQFPFHFWLPNAMEAPSPVSAYLHSSTMVKAGVFLLARMNPILGGTEAWRDTLMLVGGVTMVLSAYMAARQVYMKRLLAYTTVSALGTLVFLIGVGTEGAMLAMGAFLLTHALYKGALFLVAGSVDHETGEKNIERLGGLFRAMPITGTSAALAALSMAGVPVFFGFIGKELVIEAVWYDERNRALTVAAVEIMALFNVAVALMVGVKPFFGRRLETPKHPHEAPWTMVTGQVVLAGLGLAMGLAATALATPIVGPAVSAAFGTAVETKLALWHGFTMPLLFSAAALAAGAVAFLLRHPFRRLTEPFEFISRIGPERVYGWAFDGLMAVARGQTRVLQSGYLRFYLLYVVFTTVVLVGFPLVTLVGLPTVDFSALADTRPHEAVLIGVIIASTLAVIFARGRLAAVAALGVVGYAITTLYVLFGAPDLALTQFSIETLTVILLVLVLYRLPRFAQYSRSASRLRDGLIAVTAGALMGGLTLVAEYMGRANNPISTYFSENAVEKGKGRNIVNVIIVDFRAMDTFGEIFVLAIAAVGVYTLLRLRIREAGVRRSGEKGARA